MQGMEVNPGNSNLIIHRALLSMQRTGDLNATSQEIHRAIQVAGPGGGGGGLKTGFPGCLKQPNFADVGAIERKSRDENWVLHFQLSIHP